MFGIGHPAESTGSQIRHLTSPPHDWRRAVMSWPVATILASWQLIHRRRRYSKTCKSLVPKALLKVALDRSRWLSCQKTQSRGSVAT